MRVMLNTSLPAAFLYAMWETGELRRCFSFAVADSFAETECNRVHDECLFVSAETCCNTTP